MVLDLIQRAAAYRQSTPIREAIEASLPAGAILRDFSVFPGSDPSVTEEQVAAEIRRGLAAIHDGDLEIVPDEEIG